MLFFTALVVYVLFVFRNAFSINFFQDDFFFLKISNVKNIVDFLNFYSPFRQYSYKPLAGETFYFIIHLLSNNVILGHLIVFVTYFIGLMFLYQIIKLLMKNDLLAKLSVFFYAISFIHVFQLYWFATFQEIAIFTFLVVSFYTFLRNKYLLSVIFFILACLCKETAVLYAPFLVLYVIIANRGKLMNVKKQFIPLVIILAVTLLFWLMYRYSLSFVTQLDNYKMVWNPRLLLNNGMWYFLWAWGAPNFMPDYFRSIFSQPIPAFWKMLTNPVTRIYFYIVIAYFILFIGLTVVMLLKHKQAKRTLSIFIYCIVNFFIFLGPILFFLHKWMIRLTLPLLFVVFIQALIISLLLNRQNKYFRYAGYILICLYVIWNFLGIKVHEETSTYLLENKIFHNASQYFGEHRQEILSHNVIYFKDTTNNLPKGWNGSEKLKLSFAEQSFLDYYFPDANLKAVYGFEDEQIPNNAYVVESNIFLK